MRPRSPASVSGPAAVSGETDVAGAKPSARVAWGLGLVLCAVTLLAYVPALSAGYIWDDDWYLTENPLLRDLDGLRRIWIPGNTPQYYPAVFTAFWVERRFFGLEPAGYHALNVILHALNALLVWRLCRKLSIPGAWFIGAVFALHPVQVESVAWIAERKNVLSGFFYLLSALAYLRFQERREAPASPAVTARAAWKWYLTALALFTLALLSKTVTCSLPAALILVMVWQGQRLTLRRLAPLAPMFALGFALAMQTVHLERVHVGAQGAEFDLSLVERLLVASKALLFYPAKLLLPWPLVFVYPRWELEPARLASFWPVVLVLLFAVLACVPWSAGRRGPALALAFFAGTIFPALGFFNVYPMRYSFVADHFQYLASLGLVALLVGGAATFVARRELAAILGTVLLALLVLLTWRQASLYADQESLWRATIRQNPGAWMAHSNLAKFLSERGDNQQALAHLGDALALDPGKKAGDQIRLNLALTLGKLGRHAEALERFRELQASSGGMEVRIALTLERLGRDAEAEAQFRAALADPSEGSGRSDSARIENVMVPFGLHLLRRGRPEEAAEWLGRFLGQHPDDADALMFFADASAGAGRLDEAIRAAERALTLTRKRGDPRSAGLIEQRLGQYRASRP